MEKKRILSGMRPTGPLHLGHMVGALENWRVLQEEYECFYMVADWHALMSEYEDPSRIREYARLCVAEWIACGVDPDRSVMFVQSMVPQHAELHLVLSNLISVARLERCPTYKEQLKEIKGKNLATYGFFGYPVLQAADILLYRAEVVPVGMDQLPHIEITREIARKFNSLYGEVFPEPEPRITRIGKLLGLDGRKMSKSYGNTVDLVEEPDVVREKVMTMFTDPQRIKRADPGRPEVCNVHAYYETFFPECADIVAMECTSAVRGCTDCKRELGDRLVEFLAPIRRKVDELLKGGEVDDILEEGNRIASEVAAETMSIVMKSVGLR